MNVNDMVHLFNRTVKNILHNFIPHEIITCDDRNTPWINSSVKRLISALKEETTTIDTLKLFNLFSIY